MDIPHHPRTARTPTTLAELLQQDKCLDSASSDNESTIVDFHKSERAKPFARSQTRSQPTNTATDRPSRGMMRESPPALPPRKRFRASSPYRRYRQGSDEQTVYLQPTSRRPSTKELSLPAEGTDRDEGLVYGEYRGDEWIPHQSLMMWLTSYAAVSLVRKAGDMLEKRAQAKEAVSTQVEHLRSASSKTRGSAQTVVGEYTRARHDSVV